MGETIRRNAAAESILADAKTALTNAQAKGGAWATHATDKLGSTLALAVTIAARLATARDLLVPLEAALAAQDELADKFLGRIADQIWNDVGRPGSDASLSILFPGGIAYYAEGDESTQPERMTLLAELLESDIHPRLAADAARAYATEVRGQAGALEEKVAAAAGPRRQVALLEKIEGALARVAHSNLSALKRAYKAEGFSETEIHTVIPDRPRPRKAPPKPE